MSNSLSPFLDTFRLWTRSSTRKNPVFLVVQRNARYAYHLHDYLHDIGSSRDFFEKDAFSIQEVDPVTAGALLGCHLGSFGVQIAQKMPICPFKGFTAIVFAPDQISYAAYRTGRGLIEFARGEVPVTIAEKPVADSTSSVQGRMSPPIDAESVIARLRAARKLLDTGAVQNPQQGKLDDHEPREEQRVNSDHLLDKQEEEYQVDVDDQPELDDQPAGHGEQPDKLVNDLQRYVDRPGMVALLVANMKRTNPGSEKAFLQYLASRPALADLAWQVKLQLGG